MNVCMAIAAVAVIAVATGVIIGLLGLFYFMCSKLLEDDDETEG